MRRVVMAVTVTAVLAVPAATAGAATVPPINCGIVSCTYPVERAIERLTEGSAGVRECIDNGVGALRNIVQGTPQPGVCNP